MQYVKLDFFIIIRKYKKRSAFLLSVMGWIMEFESMTSRATIWHSNQLNYIHHILAWFSEP